MIGIYKITNIITNQTYIGRSCNIERRWMEHKTPKNNKYAIDKDIKELGKENFKLSVIEECSKELLKEREEYYILKEKPFYNLRVLDNSCSEETKEKLRVSCKKWWDELPDETKSKIVKGNLTHRGWDGHKVP